MLTLESCLNKIVNCSDGHPRRLIKITERHLVYEVPIGSGTWLDFGETRRSECEHLFTEGHIDGNQK